MALSTAPAGTFMPGTKVQVGGHRVVIEKYLSEGGFAHVYVVRLRQPVDGSETAVLKRVAVPDKDALASMRTEVETMKRLKGHKPIVTYIDSHASQLKGGGYEVFLLMEFCSGGGLIDFMNTRLQNRLTEPEILKIFTDVAEGVACMHYLKPPLLHRDLKVENVLISMTGSSFRYKVCDFGSAAPPRPAATSAAEGRLIEDDVQRHTTLQYRSPEMIDVYRKQPIDEKSDIWALGVLLYKLCYYTTPFEEVGQMAILNAKFKYPAYPQFSDKLKLLIAHMLKEEPHKRPNIYQVLREACHMRGKEVPIRDIYSGRSQSEARRNQQLPPSPTETPKVGAVFSPPMQETQILPEIAPMRRGRPTKPSTQPITSKPSPSPLRANASDPFAALDGHNKHDTTDELSARFPTLDQFSLLHEKGGKFDFEPTTAASSSDSSAPEDDGLSKRITNALADEAFAKPAVPSKAHVSARVDVHTEPSHSKVPNIATEPIQHKTSFHQPVPQKPKMVSTGTMTSPSVIRDTDSPPLSRQASHRYSVREQERQPSRSWDQGPEVAHRASDHSVGRPAHTRYESRLLSEEIPKSPVSSRPSLEGSRPSVADFSDPLTRSKSANAKARPVSAFVPSRADYVRDRERERSSFDSIRNQQDGNPLLRPSRPELDRDYSQSSITSDIDFLRAKEEEEMNRKKEKRLSSGTKHVKRSSLTSLSISGKTLFAGRFGDAFRRFETNTAQERGSRSPSPENIKGRLTPVTGSEVTDVSDDGRDFNDDADDISPEMRRELERRRLSLEEKRVANAAAEYRSRMAERREGGSRASNLGLGGGGGMRSSVIENRVQSLYKDNDKPTPPKTASGYGRYTDEDTNPAEKWYEAPLPERPTTSIPRKSISSPSVPQDFRPKPPQKDIHIRASEAKQNIGQQQQQQQQHHRAAPNDAPRPPAPPKPIRLRTGSNLAAHAGGDHKAENPSPTTGNNTSSRATSRDEWELNFSRRYPSLSGLELVETELGIPQAPPVRNTATTKEV